MSACEGQHDVTCCEACALIQLDKARAQITALEVDQRKEREALRAQLAEARKIPDLTDDELSALIEACNVAKHGRPRPPWDRAGWSAHKKLVAEEVRRSRQPAPVAAPESPRPYKLVSVPGLGYGDQRIDGPGTLTLICSDGHLPASFVEEQLNLAYRLGQRSAHA